MAKIKPKRISAEQILGEQGVNLIARRFLDMGFPWHPTNAPVEAGIDGHVELRDPQSGETSNVWLAVQSKARTRLEKETETGFQFTCTPRDLDYWRRGNMPVLLVVVRPDTDEAWWMPVKEYFDDARHATSRIVRFDKQANALRAESADELLALAQTAGAATYFRPAPRREQLELSLLPLKRVPQAVYRAETFFKDPADLVEALKEHVEYPPREWFVHGGAIYSVHDLRDGPWTEVCEIGTVERFDGDEWAAATDPEQQRLFVRLVNSCLRSLLGRLGMRYYKDARCYHFKATKDLATRTKSYKSRQQQTTREVFREYRSKKDPSKVLYYRHVGFEPWIRQFDGKWCMEINPTYLFTSDGHAIHPYHQEYLAKIKSIEGSGAVGNLVVMFARLLRDRDGLFAGRENYPHLGFGELLGVDLNVGINDSSWAKPSAKVATPEVDPEDADAFTASADADESPLFEPEDE